MAKRRRKRKKDKRIKHVFISPISGIMRLRSGRKVTHAEIPSTAKFHHKEHEPELFR
jgi:hypothetical protein